jgi:hypothetical protein
LHNESLALVCVGCGNESLLSCNYSRALDEFDKASSLLKKLEEPCLELDFLISFGKVIAYDNLGLKQECQNSLTSLFLILNEEEDINENYELDNSTNQLPEEYAEADQIMKKLALLAYSPNIRGLLLSLLDEMFENLLPLFKIAEPAFLGQNDWKFDTNTEAYNNLCKSFWKNLKRRPAEYTNA